LGIKKKKKKKEQTGWKCELKHISQVSEHTGSYGLQFLGINFL